MDHDWTSAYPPGVPAQIDVHAWASLTDLLERSLARHRDRPALECGGTVLSYDTLDRLTQDFASYLQNVVGLDKGDRVALMLGNCLQWPVALLGTLRAGMAAVAINPAYTARELEARLGDSGARAIVIAEERCPTLQSIVTRTRIEAVVTTAPGDLLRFPQGLFCNLRDRRARRGEASRWRIGGAIPLRTALARGKAQPYNRVTLTHQDLALLHYTGGTTGTSKAATLLHGNLVANVLQARAWLYPLRGDGGETLVTALPLFHLFAITAGCLFGVSLGARNLLASNPSVAAGVVAEIGRRPFHLLTGLNALFDALPFAEGFGGLDFSALRCALLAGAPLPPAAAERWRNATGAPLLETYGLTEASPLVCAQLPEGGARGAGIGLPLPSTQLEIRDEDDAAVAPGERGELCVRGPQVMQGYWQKPEENARVFGPDGFLRTGDIAQLDADGALRIVDRKKQLISVGGLNVHPAEIEAVLAAHPDVVECACVGVPDDATGEAIKAVVVARSGTVSAAELRSHCEHGLTAYKVPKHFEFRGRLPKSRGGRVLRAELKAAAPAPPA